MSEAEPANHAERPFEHDVVVLLVDDQAIIGEAVRRMLQPHDDITFHFCQEPKKALEQAAERRPTVILQDLIMPDVDGLDLVREYRQQDATRLTPLIVLSMKEEADTKAEAFARGANDYLVKLPDPIELVARIRYHSRGYIALLERNEAFDALEKSEKALRTELTLAAQYVRSLLPEPEDRIVKTDWRFIPSASLGGDAFDYQWLDDTHFAICLLDVCGHGVGPALLSVSVLNVLRSRALPGADFHDPTAVLTGLNHAFQMAEHNSMFFTMWYGVYDTNTRQLRFAGAGHPPALLIPQQCAEANPVRQLASQSLMIGVDPTVEFPSDACDVGPGDQLYVYSDGVFEIACPDGKMWEFEDFVTLMGRNATAGESKIERLIAHARKLQNKEMFEDDFSIMEVTF